MMPDQLAAIIQLSSRSPFEERLAALQTLCHQAASAGAELLVLPENFAYYGEQDLSTIADKESTPQGTVRQCLSNLARELNCWIVGGTLPLWPLPSWSQPLCPHPEHHSESLPYASALVFDPQGETPFRYDKIHLFDITLPQQKRRYHESDTYTAGNGDTLVFDTPVGKVGVLICFDLRFPGLALELRDKGADIIVAPSAFTRETGEAHWQLLLQARALDTQCYVLGSNLAGRDHRKPTWGGSTAVDPWGKVVGQLDDEEGFILVDIDRDKLQSVRQGLPLQQLRRK